MGNNDENEGCPTFNWEYIDQIAVGIWGAQLLNKRPVRPVTGATLNSAALRDFMDARGQWQVPVAWSCYTSDVQRSCHSNGTILLNLGGEHCFFSSCFGVIYDISFFFG